MKEEPVTDSGNNDINAMNLDSTNDSTNDSSIAMDVVDGAYFADGSTTSTDFESPPDRTEDLIRLYAPQRSLANVVRKLEF